MSMDWSQTRVLVTGGDGFLGHHVVEKLRAAACRNLFVVHHQEYDLTREAQVSELFRQHPCDLVIHLAGLVGGIAANQARPAEFFYQNLMMGVLTMDCAWKAGAQKFVCAGAGCGYPEDAPLPLHESSFWQGFPQQPSAPYSLAKRMLHVQSLAYWRQYSFPAIVTIPGNIYGPHDNFDLENAHVLPALVRKFVEATADGDGRGNTITVWGTGRPTRDFVYAGDVADGILRAAELYDRAELVNLSSGREHSIREVVGLIAELTGFRGVIAWDGSRPDGQARRLFDIGKARRELGYRPRTNLRDGLKLTIDWYRQHRAQARNSPAVQAAVASAR